MLIKTYFQTNANSKDAFIFSFFTMKMSTEELIELQCYVTAMFKSYSGD